MSLGENSAFVDHEPSGSSNTTSTSFAQARNFFKNNVMSDFHHSVAVSPLPLHKFRKNYVPYMKNSVAPLSFPLAIAL